MIRAFLSRLTRSDFTRAVAMLSGGQMIAAVIPILAAPILGRLYPPEQYGALAAYMAFANVFAVLATLQLHHAILLQTTDQNAHEVVSTVLTVAGVAAAVAAILAAGLFFQLEGGAFREARWWALMLPFTVYTVGQTGAVSVLANRARRFGDLARLPVVSSVVIVSLSIILGFLNWGVHGLFAGYFAGQIISFLVYRWLLNRLAPHRRAPSLLEQWQWVKRYRRFPLFTAPSEMAGTFNMQAPIFALGVLDAVAAIGAFGRARQLIGMPLQMVGSSIGQVFRQKAAVAFTQTGDCRKLYRNTGLVLLCVGTPPTVILGLFAPDMFRIILGPAWEPAGHLTRIIAPALLLQFVCSPIATVFYIAERQKDEFVLALFALALQIGSMAIGALIVRTPEAVLAGYTIAFCIIYTTYIVRGWQVSGPDAR